MQDSLIGYHLDGDTVKRNNAAAWQRAVRRVTVRKLKNRLSKDHGRVKAGLVISIAKKPSDEGIEAMVRERVARWGGGTPRGARRPPKIKGPSVAEAVIEGRR